MPVHVGPARASDIGWIDSDDTPCLRLDMGPDAWSGDGDPMAGPSAWFEEVRFGPAESCPVPEPG